MWLQCSGKQQIAPWQRFRIFCHLKPEICIWNLKLLWFQIQFLIFKKSKLSHFLPNHLWSIYTSYITVKYFLKSKSNRLGFEYNGLPHLLVVLRELSHQFHFPWRVSFKEGSGCQQISERTSSLLLPWNGLGFCLSKVEMGAQQIEVSRFHSWFKWHFLEQHG